MPLYLLSVFAHHDDAVTFFFGQLTGRKMIQITPFHRLVSQVHQEEAQVAIV